jgi:formylglycine-generating enzyme required for sulfatase activity
MNPTLKTFLVLAPVLWLLSACGELTTDDRSLDLQIHGNGVVSIDTLGIGASGFHELALIPRPDSGFVFDRWEGAAGGHDSPLIVPLIGTVRVDAHFKPVPSPVSFIDTPFALIPAGEFRMGSEFAFEDDRERPVHEVIISRPFYLSIHEVTQELWTNVMGYNPSPVSEPTAPVTGVGWFEVQDFFRALNTTGEGAVYRLPTEAEWEYACRAGTTTDFFHGNDEQRLRDYAWYAANWKASDGHHAVGTRRPNRFGLYDMLGNAWEWVQDAFDPLYYAASPLTDPQGPPHATLGRVIRGGGYSGAGWTRCSARNHEFPEVAATDVGFRMVRVIQ